MQDRVIVDNMSEFEHSSSRASCTFSMQDSRVKRGSNIGHKTQQARLPADSGLYNSSFPSLVNCILNHSRVSKRSPRLVYKHSMVPDKASALSIILALHWALKVVRQSPTWRQSVHKISYCLLLLLCSCFARCSCFAHCCHDPFIVRSASNLSTSSLVFTQTEDH